MKTVSSWTSSSIYSFKSIDLERGKLKLSAVNLLIDKAGNKECFQSIRERRRY